MTSSSGAGVNHDVSSAADTGTMENPKMRRIPEYKANIGHSANFHYDTSLYFIKGRIIQIPWPMLLHCARATNTHGGNAIFGMQMDKKEIRRTQSR